MAAHAIDLAAGRQRLAEKMLAAAGVMLNKFNKPYRVYSIGGRNNVYTEKVLDAAPVKVHRNIITTAAITFDALTRIVERDPDLSGAQSVVQSLEAGILAAAEVPQQPETKETDEEA